MRGLVLHWWQTELLKELEKAVRDGKPMRILHLESPRRDRGEFVIMGVDTALTGKDRSTMVIIDDPYAEEARTLEGEFREICEAKLLAHAPSTEKNRGPQPRTKYPRRR
jgi:hypothetical protein